MISRVKLLTIITCMLVLCARSQAADLSIAVKDIRSNNGQLIIAVFDTQEAFDNADDDQAYALYINKIHGGESKITLHKVPAGRYAVSLFHDENSNSEMDITTTDMPTEGYGISNAHNQYESPDFNKAAVTIDGVREQVIIKMNYLTSAGGDSANKMSAGKKTAVPDSVER